MDITGTCVVYGHQAELTLIFGTFLGVSGLSMGGVHACMVASLCPMDLACSPLLAPRSAAVAFCEGMLQFGIQDWRPLASSTDECANVCGDLCICKT